MWKYGKSYSIIRIVLSLYLFVLFIMLGSVSHAWDSRAQHFDKHKVYINLSGEGDFGVMTIKGRIIEVMESFPLQLIVDVDGVQYYVGLLVETSVIEAGRAVDADILRPGLDITIRGERSEISKTAMIAKSIALK